MEGCRQATPSNLFFNSSSIHHPVSSFISNPSAHRAHQFPVDMKNKKELSALRVRQMEHAAKKDEGEQDKDPANELLNALARYQMLLQRLENHQRHSSVHLDPKYSDLTIVCGDEEYTVHKCIVCPRSAFFAKVCDSGLQVRHQGNETIHRWRTSANSTKESSTNRIKPQEESILVKGMIEYFYHLDYEVQPHSPETDIFIGLDKPTSDTDTDTTEAPSESAEDPVTTVDPLSVPILMYSLADRVFTEGLKVLSKEKLGQELGRRLNSKIFPHAIAQIYNSTPANDRGLRDMAIKLTMDNIKELRAAQVAPSTFPDSLVRSTPQFASDLAVAMMEKMVADWQHRGVRGTNSNSAYY
ncbi:hypothetical protein N7517_003356 [Penicillium concentricum]|uniref:BTB domain-containing protein n=1 Tax=Penicillium concentricum TaxID=293559 RepID=A0A9W9SVQ5_9EURO|nr:uncharacterized protein N7517_003356 [Penicillium concentricum]KAJ5385445.1 hypothetical protein N7517_003356 [Penicillium concentricum]